MSVRKNILVSILSFICLAWCCLHSFILKIQTVPPFLFLLSPFFSIFKNGFFSSWSTSVKWYNRERVRYVYGCKVEMCTYQSFSSRDVFWTINRMWLYIQTYLLSEYITFDYFGYTITACLYIYTLFFQMSSLSRLGWLSHRAVGCLSHVLILCSLSCCWLVTLWSLMLAGCRFLLRANWDLGTITQFCNVGDLGMTTHIIQKPKERIQLYSAKT